MGYIIKFARTEAEFSQIHRLNYETFVDEIPQHEKNERQSLIDQFHEENEYIICKKEDEVVGMITVRGKRPFSLDQKLGDITKFLPENVENPCEIRLLAVKKDARNGIVFYRLISGLARYCYLQGYDAALISGTTRELKLYKHLGFEPFAHLVGQEGAYFQPMILTRESFQQAEDKKKLIDLKFYLPGPIDAMENVKSVFLEQPLWHRSQIYKQLIRNVKNSLIQLTSGREVQLMMGSGTLANDMIAAFLTNIHGKGLIVTNGEFGERLVDHAIRTQLNFDTISFPWGTPFCREELEREVEKHDYSWIWAVHCETSTGMLNDIEMLKQLARNFGCKLCLDCISSIGSVPVNLEDVFLASGVSGKSLGAISGLAFIFHQPNMPISKKLPRYLDLDLYIKQEVPFTQSSYLVKSLQEALKVMKANYFQERMKRYKKFCALLRQAGFSLLIDEKHQSPTVLTIPFQNRLAVEIGDDLVLNGYYVHTKNRYLLEKNWLQISLMGTNSERDDEKLIKLIFELTQ